MLIMRVTSRSDGAERLPDVLPFDRVVADHAATVLRVCRAALGRVDADDAWSETFLAAMRAYDDLPAGANVEAWLVTIAHRKAIDVRRGAARRPAPVETVPDAPHDPTDPTEHDDLYAALAALPDKQRLSLAYHHLGGLSYREVAELLGGTEAAARRAAADGMARLRAHYLTGAST